MSNIDSPPLAHEQMSIPREPVYKRAWTKVSTRDGWIGDFDFRGLCLPTFPYGKKAKANRRPTPFYALEADLPLLLAIVVGFQHSLAMLAGVITPPIIFASSLALDADTRSYMISASLISSGILSIIQMSRIHIWKNYYLGTGLITVVGTSFASLGMASAVFDALYADGTCKSTVANGITTRLACPDAYGALIGTTALCSLLEMAMSFVPPQKLRKIFPPLVTGITVVLIGASLIGKSGFLNWGGGTNGCQLKPAAPSIFRLCPTISGKNPLPFGSPQLLGLGFLSFITIVIVEIFGSPFMRNASIIIGLIVGMVVAGATGYVDPSSITTAPAVTFLWVKTFKLSIYAPAILPSFAVYIVLAMEAIGDITASSEISRVAVDGPEFDSRIQGGILADGLAGLLSGLFTVTPMSIFAQNNGVIALTQCANRKAGYCCAGFLILFGTLGKISGVFLAIPNSVLGGVTSFLFASVMVSGIKVLSYLKFTRKERFVLAASAVFGFGNLLVPTWGTSMFDGVQNPSAALKGFFNSIIVIITTPYLIAGVVGVLLNAIVPDDVPQKETIEHSPSFEDSNALEAGALPRTGEKDSDFDDEEYKARVDRPTKTTVLEA